MVTDSPHYTLSQDYDRMLVLLEKGPLLGFVNYDPGDALRDTVCIKRMHFRNGYEYRAGVRGLGYFNTWGREKEEQFVALCRKYNLAYIVPNAEVSDAKP